MLDWLQDTQGSFTRLPIYNRGQSQGFGNVLGQSMNMLQNMPRPSFDPIAQQARTQFNQQTVPGLAERFSSMGGGLSSPAFAQQLGQASAGLEGNLAAMQSQFDLQRLSQDRDFATNLLGVGLRPQYDAKWQPNQSGFGTMASSGLMAALGQMAPTLLKMGSSAAGLGTGGTAAAIGIPALAALLAYMGQPSQQSNPYQGYDQYFGGSNNFGGF